MVSFQIQTGIFFQSGIVNLYLNWKFHHLSLSYLNEKLFDEEEVWVRVKVLVKAEERPRRLQAVASHLQLALRVYVLHQEL